MAAKTHMHPMTMPAVQPQNPITLSSHVDRRFMPKMPATTAPSAAAKLPMLSVSSSRLTYTVAVAVKSVLWFQA